jgi:dienelactone hydrolase
MPVRVIARLVVLTLALTTLTRCARLGFLGNGLGQTLTADLRRMPAEDPAAPRSDDVVAIGLEPPGAGFAFTLYRPRRLHGRAPGVVFLPARFAPEPLYESYGRLLAARGFVVVVRAQYSWFDADESLMQNTLWMADWLRRSGLVNPDQIAVAGHSMGGRVAIMAAVADPRFRAVVSIDPGGDRSYPVINNLVPRLRAPLLLIGAEVAWRGWNICAPRETNYQRFFEHSPPGTVELTILGADHVQLTDDPEIIGMGMCRVGTADSLMVRFVSRRATVLFIEEHTLGRPHVPLEVPDLATLRVRPAPPPSAVLDASPPARSSRASPPTGG